MNRLLQLSPLLVAAIVSAGTATVVTRGAGDRAPQTLEVGVALPGAPIPSTLYGIFFEDINFGADGGLYPERMKNRSFEFPESLMGWQNSRGRRRNLRGARPTTRSGRAIRTTCASPSRRRASLRYQERWIPWHRREQGAHYTISVVARRRTGEAATLRFDLQDTSGTTSSASAKIDGSPDRRGRPTARRSSPRAPKHADGWRSMWTGRRDRRGRGLALSRRHLQPPQERTPRRSRAAR